jgi:hypothetical protein
MVMYLEEIEAEDSAPGRKHWEREALAWLETRWCQRRLKAILNALATWCGEQWRPMSLSF